MSLSSYKSLIDARLNYLKTNEMPTKVADELDHVLTLPHPEREIQFVSWCTRSTQERRLRSKAVSAS